MVPLDFSFFKSHPLSLYGWSRGLRDQKPLIKYMALYRFLSLFPQRIPVESSKPVQRHHELQDIGAKQDVVADSLVALGHEVPAVDGPDQEPAVDDDGLHEVEQVQGGQRDPFLFLKLEASKLRVNFMRQKPA